MYPGQDNSFAKVVDTLSWQLIENVGIFDLKKAVKTDISNEARLYFETGSCRVKKLTKTVCVNPTLLDPLTRAWRVRYCLCPFESYLPLTNEELNTSAKDGTLIRSCQKILANLLSSYRKRKETAKIYIHFGDGMEFCCTQTTEKFDIIDSSVCADHVGLANLINVCSDRLTNTPESMLFTGSMNFVNVANSNRVEEYVEKSLFCPLSMIPTIYGWRLVDHVQLGAATLVHPTRPMVPPITLRWQKAPPPRNLALCPSPVLDCFQELLARKCFDFKSKRANGSLPGDFCGMFDYTPLTFSNIIDSMIQRVGADRWLKDARQLDISPTFNLARRTTEALKNGQMVLKLSARNSPNISEKSHFQRIVSIGGNGVRLRMVLIPTRFLPVPPSRLRTDSYFADPDVHFIDNFDFRGERTQDGDVGDFTTSFLLLPDHGLGETHIAMVFELSNGFPVFGFQMLLKSMQVEEFRLPVSQESSVPHVVSGEELQVDRCVEIKDEYILKIRMKSGGNTGIFSVSKSCF